MRITNAMLVSNFSSNLTRNTSKLDKLQTQMSTQKKNMRASDDPIAAGKSMQIRSNLSRVQQYSNSVVEAKEMLGQTESSLNDINSLIGRVYEQASKGASGTNGADERNSIASEIEQLSQQILATVNTSFSGRYIFGGENTVKQPFEVKDVSGEKVLFYNGNNVNELTLPANSATLDKLSSERLSYQLSPGVVMDTSYNGIDVLGAGDNNVFSIINNLKNGLQNNDTDAIQKSLDLIQGKQNNILSLVSEIGGKSNRLDFFESRLESDDYNYKNMLSQVEDVDVEKTVMELKMQEMVFEAALAAGSKIVSKTLADFLG